MSEQANGWLGRSALRFIGIQQERNLYRRMEAAGTSEWPLIAGTRMISAFGSSIFFPLSAGLKQTAIGDIPFFGGLIRLGGFAFDVAMDTTTPLPIAGQVSRLAYQGIVSLGIEKLPPSKNYPIRTRRQVA